MGKKRKSDNVSRAVASHRLNSKKRKKGNVVDRLSSLPNDLIHKILSFISIKDTVKTSALSTRYRFLWTTMPYLNFSTEDFPHLYLNYSTKDLKKFSKIVKRFLKRRDSRIDVSSLKLRFPGKVTAFFKKLLRYAFSHNIQHLDVQCLRKDDVKFPLSLFTSMSLKHLIIHRSGFDRYVFPALTTLYLQEVTFSSDDGILSECPNLKSLTLKSCETKGLSSFSIFHPGLSDLTLDSLDNNVTVVNVVAPQLENLTIRCKYFSWSLNPTLREHVIAAPNLASLSYRGFYPLHLSTDGFHCLKEADICVTHLHIKPRQIVCLLQQLHNVEFLTLNTEIIELLSSNVELISHQPSPFVNLKSLTIYPKELSEAGLPKGIVSLSTEVKNYLLDSSPGATFTLFSREEIIAKENAKLAQKLMTSLQRRLKWETNKAQMERWKAPCVGAELQIYNYWRYMTLQIEDGEEKTSDIVSDLRRIKDVMIKLPTSKRVEMQACFSSLCAEAETVVNQIIDRVNLHLQCHMEHSHFSGCFQEIATKF